MDNADDINFFPYMILEFDGIQFGYDERQLLSGIYVKCEIGKITGLLGRNGSGKSTLLRLVFGSKQTEIMSVRIDKIALSLPAFTSRKIAYLPQQKFVPNDLTLKRILTINRVNKNDLLHFFPELKDDLSLKPDELSGGRLRLFEILLVLNSPATFCLLDEPFTGLTPVLVERVKDYIHQIKSKKGILITDHLYRQVMSLSDSLYILNNGKTYSVKNEEDMIKHGYLPDQE
jgi:ABC-type branched-subunit amino acid transport system ATPase component